MHDDTHPTLPPIGCNGRGVQRSSRHQPIGLQELPIREQFRLVSETGAFDCFDRLPLRTQMAEYEAAIAEFNLPVHTASWFYRLGEDEALLTHNLRICQAIGARCHNIMTFKHHRDGHVLDDAEITDHYLRVYDDAMSLGVEPQLRAARQHVDRGFPARTRGGPARAGAWRALPLHAGLQPCELQDRQPGRAGTVGRARTGGERQTGAGPLRARLPVRTMAGHGHRALGPAARSRPQPTPEPVAPQRGRQPWPGHPVPPCCGPAPGEWHSPWHAYLLEPSKEAIRKVLAYHHAHPHSPLRHLTTEFINLPDYGLGARYDLLAQNVAAARFMRQAWDEICARPAVQASCKGAS